MKIIKIKLKEIKVKSFITKMSALQLETAKGGSSIPITTVKLNYPTDTSILEDFSFNCL